MIVKMKFLSITGPRADIDRMTNRYLSKYEMQLENALTELKTVDNLMPFLDIFPNMRCSLKMHSRSSRQ